MTDNTRAAQYLCVMLAFGLLFSGMAAIILTANELVAGIFLILSLVPLLRLCLYPRKYTRCKICGERVVNEVHHQIAHVSEHARNKEE
jgi:hypothetical protein